METLTLIKLRDLITNQIQENLHLEYKSCAVLNNSNRDELLNDLTKQVAAFANADGGTLIFGIKEGQGRDKKHLPESLDEGFTRGGKVSAIWLEDILLSNISPKIQGLKPYEIELENGNFLLVLEVPPSQYGPHMAKDYRYYKRRQTKAEPMEHYEVEDVRNRSRGPLLRLTVDFKHLIEVPGGRAYKPFEQGNEYPLYLSIENLVDRPAEYAAITFYLDWDWRAQIDGNYYEWKSNSEEIYSEDLGLSLTNGGCGFYSYKMQVGLPSAPPIWKDNPVEVRSLPFKVSLRVNALDQFYIGYEITAPYMPTQRQFYCVSTKAKGGTEIYIRGITEL